MRQRISDPQWDYSLPLAVAPEEFVAHFHIYADESGKLAQSDYTSFCGYIAHVSEWQRFSQEWNNCRLGWGVPPLHLSRIMFPQRKDDEWKDIWLKWGKEWEGKRDLMLGDFASVVLGSQIVCIGAVVDADHFRSLPDCEFKKEAKNPILLSFQKVLMEGIEKTEVIDKHSPISVVIDDDEEYAMDCYKWLSDLKKDARLQKVKDRIHGICFVNDADYPGIQVSDMIAFEARRLMVERMKTPGVSPSKLYSALTKHGIHQPQLMTAEFLDRLSRNVNEALKP
ncbi:MAG TPA: DUF3800 domain-containing protein [Methylomirabilota bacterium]|nr:DUF3800 domain-containing protein [Methylomirabilota bacterium]